VHTNYAIVWALWIGAICGAVAQIVSYWTAQWTLIRTIVLALGLVAVLASALAGQFAIIEWGNLPKSWSEVEPGQIWNNGGVPSIRP
jgi:hypothetical protein